MSLPEGLIAGATGHVGHHNSLHELFNDGIANAHVAAAAAIAGSKLDFDITDAGDVDLASIVNGDGVRWDTSAGKLKRGPAPFIDVTAPPYNALGNNVDDTAAVLAAMTAGATLGRPVFFPNGIYTVLEPIPFRTSMVGESIAATKIRAHSSFVGGQLIDFDVSPEMKTIRSMSFDANFKTSVQIFGSTGDASGSSQALFSDLQFTNTAPGVYAVGGSSSTVVGGMLTGSTFIRCTWNNTAQPLYVGVNQDDVKFIGCRIIMLNANQPTQPPLKVWGANVHFDTCYFYVEDVDFTSNTVAANNSLGQFADGTRWWAWVGGPSQAFENCFFETNNSNITDLFWDTGLGHSLILRNLHLNLNTSSALRAVLRTQLVAGSVDHTLYHEIRNVSRINDDDYGLVEFHQNTAGLALTERVVLDLGGVDSFAADLVRLTAQSTASAVPGYVLHGPAAGATVKVTGGGKETVHAHGTTGTTETIDLALGNVHTATLDNNCTFTFTGASNGYGCSFRLHLTQDATGSRTVTWPASVKWPDGTAPVLSTGATKRDTFTFETLDGGTIWDGYMSGHDVR